MSDAAPLKKSSPFDRSLVEGPISPAVWKLAWPTMVQNLVAGMQGVIDHVLVGQLIGYTANAAIGVSWQIFLVVIVFMASLFTGQAVLVARFAGAGDSDRVNQADPAAGGDDLAGDVRRDGSGWLRHWRRGFLDLVNAAPDVKQHALPFLRISFIGSIGMLFFFMLTAAMRAAGDAQTPLRLGVTMTISQCRPQRPADSGRRPDSAARHGRLRTWNGHRVRHRSAPTRLQRSVVEVPGAVGAVGHGATMM